MKGLLESTRSATAVLVAIVSLAGAGSAQAVVTLNEFGAFTTSAWGDCLDPCSLGDVSLTTLVGPGTGGPGTLSTSQTLGQPDTGGAGSLFAEATILGGLSTPLLRASATSNSLTYATTQAVAAQAYEVIGGGAGQVLNFSVALTGTVTKLGGDATGLAATVGVAKVASPGDFLLQQTLLLALFDPDAVRLEQTAAGAVNLAGNASITVDEGDQFYLWALLGAAAGGSGSIADATSTLSVAFDAGAGAVLSAVGVPLPAPLLLLASALALVSFPRRR